jgi:hypothetical protein
VVIVFSASLAKLHVMFTVRPLTPLHPYTVAVSFATSAHLSPRKVQLIGAFTTPRCGYYNRLALHYVRLSYSLLICTHETTREPLNRFSLNLILEPFTKCYWCILILVKTDKMSGYFVWWYIYLYGNISLNNQKQKGLYASIPLHVYSTTNIDLSNTPEYCRRNWKKVHPSWTYRLHVYKYIHN